MITKIELSAQRAGAPPAHTRRIWAGAHTEIDGQDGHAALERTSHARAVGAYSHRRQACAYTDTGGKHAHLATAQVGRRLDGTFWW
jgi:hypothetical protein